jgi:hypothetical protein
MLSGMNSVKVVTVYDIYSIKTKRFFIAIRSLDVSDVVIQ